MTLRPARGRVSEDAHEIDPVLDIAPCGFVSIADDGTVRTVNATLLDMLGFGRGEIVGATTSSLGCGR